MNRGLRAAVAALALLIASPVAVGAEISLRAPGLRLPLVDEPSYQRGLRLDLRGDHAAAAEAFRAANRRKPVARALFHFKLSDSLARMREALVRTPDSYDEHFNYAVNVQNKYWALYLDLGVKDHRLYALAEHHFQRSIRLMPLAANPVLCLASLYGQAGDRSRAQATFQALGARPLRSTDYYNLAFYHKVMGDLEEAYRILRQAVSFDARHREWLLESDDFAELREDPRLKAIIDTGALHGGTLGQLRQWTWPPPGGIQRVPRGFRIRLPPAPAPVPLP